MVGEGGEGQGRGEERGESRWSDLRWWWSEVRPRMGVGHVAGPTTLENGHRYNVKILTSPINAVHAVSKTSIEEKTETTVGNEMIVTM